MNGVFLSRSNRNDSSVCGSKPCYMAHEQWDGVESFLEANHNIHNKDSNVT